MASTCTGSAWRPRTRRGFERCLHGDDVAQLGHLIFWENATIVAEQLAAWPGGHPPAAIGQVINDIAAFAVVEEPRQVDVAPQIDPTLVELLSPFGHRRLGVGMVFGGQPAS